MTKLLFVGDIHSDSKPCMEWLSPAIKSIVKKHIFTSCNYEGASSTLHRSNLTKVGPRLTQSQELLEVCCKSGFNHFNLANNHVMDNGITGLATMVSDIKNSKSSFGGASLNPETLYEPFRIKNASQTIDIYSGCESDHGIVTSEEQKPGIAWINDPLLDQNIAISKRQKHFIIVQAHGGEETSLPLPEWKSRYHALVDSGVDLVVGHHPHSPQGWETYNGKKIFYSLGNFYFQNSKISSSNQGIMLSIEIGVKGNYSTSVIPTCVTNGSVAINQSNQENLDELSRQIVRSDYLLLATNQAVDLWEKYYSHYFANSIAHSRLKPLFGPKYNYQLITHNIKIESHRWTIIRALEQLMRKNIL